MLETKNNRKIDERSLILPELIPLHIPDFTEHTSSSIPNVLSFRKIESETWFLEFINEVVSKIGKEYYPVMRMSDGEYSFLLGDKYPYLAGHTLWGYLKKVFFLTQKKVSGAGKFKAATLPAVSSGNYDKKEIRNNYGYIVGCIRKIAEQGVLAMHLTYPLKPFQEHFHHPLKKWINEDRIPFNENNYYPFYFVYALLRGSAKEKILQDKTLLIFHGADGPKKERIIQSLKKEGADRVIWHQISGNRSMFDTVEISDDYLNADVALVGAGVGKFNILAQLEPLGIPCIDAGFVFEVWANEKNKWKRPIMVPDWEWDESKIEF